MWGVQPFMFDYSYTNLMKSLLIKNMDKNKLFFALWRYKFTWSKHGVSPLSAFKCAGHLCPTAISLMDDILGPELNVENSEKPPETLLSNKMDGLAEANQFSDALWFLVIAFSVQSTFWPTSLLWHLILKGPMYLMIL